MKNIFKYILLAAVVLTGLAGCYKDKSTYPDKQLDDIVIDTTGIPKIIYVNYRQEFSVTPTVTRNGEAGDNLTYVWDINIAANTNPMDREVIGNEMTFEGTISNPIASSPYILKLTVTDNETGVIYICAWDLYVTSNFRDGIIVSETADGTTSDFSLILNNKVTTNWNDDEKVIRNILTTVNGGPFPGLMNKIYYHPANYARTNNMWIIDHENKVSIYDCEDYSLSADMSSGLFIYAPDDFRAYGFAKANQAFFVNSSEGMFKYSYLGGAPQFGPALVPPTTSVAHNGVLADDHRINMEPPGMVWYDKSKNKFYWFFNDILPALNVVAFANDDGEGTLPFNAGDYRDKSAVAGGNTYDGNTLAMLMKDDATGNYEICTFAKYRPAAGEVPEVMPRAKGLTAIPASANALFDEAIGFVFAREEPVLYIIKGDGIYAATLGTNPANVSATPKFPAPAGETITHAILFEQGRYLYNSGDYQPGYDRYPPLDANLKSIVVATSTTATSGKLYMLPMKNIGTGDLDVEAKLEWGGFGKILDVSVQGY